ncbi:phospholipase D-like domain-containing protein [Kribbella shirazensis]|uniref:phospholipase D n=1 Tax=Kribbella shirazensis TaxID=1105143 RepID=A0A7X5VJZ0_9ACTN|nr:phospholipase D-like domain-containing protein [Kribbella shirazensis]NIK62251.1 phosphatidylserine/phosphatidylglycerophosphate/cardiolipin synthase-like enzyme [Kribbella shirazensis]
MVHRSLSFILATLLTAVAGLAVPQTAYAGQPPVTITIGSSQVDLTFNDPVDHNGQDITQLNKMIALFNGAPAGSEVRIALYSITANIVYDAIEAAVKRGVHVYVVHNGEDKNSTDDSPAALASLLGANHHWCDHGSSSLAYGGGCISNSSTGLMHAKYMLFSQTKDASGTTRSWVTWFGSPNMTYASGANLFNNSFTVYGDKTLYDNFYSQQWLPQWQENTYADNDFYVASAPRGYFGSSASNIQVYSSPEQNTDLVANRLSYIDADADCRIRVMEASINDTRSAVVDMLVSLHSGGCKVWVDVGAIQSGSLSKLKSAGIPVRKSPVHDKTIIVSARYAGSSAVRPLVFTGSHNLTASALQYNDEILVKVADSQPMYDAFYAHFNDAYNTGTAL